MTKQHYALVEKEGCSPLKFTTQQPLDRSTTGKGAEVRRELEQIYQTYADLYPNPKLIEEKRQRDTLLQAARAASTVQHQEEKATAAKRKGFFTFLFGSREDPNAGGKQTLPTGGSPSDDDEARLHYIDTPNEYDDGSLCGTLQSLDVTCIPPEVYSVARSHLTSTRTRRENPNALRWGPQSRLLTQQPKDPSEPTDASLVFIVVGLGEIAEFGGGPNSGASSSSRILPTSDRDDLQAYAGNTQSFDLSAVRGTVVSPNCIVVSWGFADGISVVYRRRLVLSRDDENFAAEEWEAVWWLGASGPVLDNMTSNAQDLFLDDADLPSSPLLRVSDCVALHVEAPEIPGEEEQANPLVATLAISRLGGYIELVPLSTPLWNGPVLQRELAEVVKRNRRRKPSQPPLHYAAGRRVASPPSILALTTFDYHLDVQSLEVHRTNVNSETTWDGEKYPEGPPAEFLLVASGMAVNGGFGESMTFWAVSTIFSSEGDNDFNFQIHSSLVEAIWTDSGAPVSVFATPGIMSQWRTPRQVELKEATRNGSATDDNDNEETPPEKPLAPVTTLSTTAPIVSMKFSSADGSSGPFLSVLDWNGAVQIFDCSVVTRLASQDLTEHEYEQYHKMHAENEQDRPSVPFCLVSSIVHRSHVTAALQKVLKSPAVGNLHWLESAGLGNSGTIPSIVFLLSHTRKLAVVTFGVHEDRLAQQNYEQGSPKPSVITVPFPSSGAAVETFQDDSLSFVSMRLGRSKSSPQTVTHLFKYFVMEQLQPVAIVEALARECKFKEAIDSASKLSKYEQNELAEVVTGCHRRLWETKRDVKSLSSTKDDSYIVRQASLLCAPNKTEHELSLDDLRSVLRLALETSAAKSEEKRSTARSNFVRLGTYEIMCKYYGSKPSLDRFRNEFLKLDLSKLSHQLAGRGDISALSIVLFRHRVEVRENLLSILGSLPLALNSASFCHLLPVFRKASVSDLFLDFSNQNGSELPWSHMPQFLLERSPIPIVIDRCDEIVVLEYNKKLNEGLDSGVISETMMADLLVKRGKSMQAFVGDVDEVVRLSEFGIKCIDGHNDNSVSPGIRELHTMCRTALSLQKMLMDQAVSINGDGIDTDDLMGMDLVDLLDLVLDARDQPSVVRYRFQQYVQPLVMEMHSSSSSDNLDQALMTYCLREAKKCSDLQMAGAMHALASAVAIAESSKASIKKEDRLIKNEECLIRMVLSVTKEIMKNLSTADASIQENRELIESIWNLYETLPAHLITSKSECESKVRVFYQDLVGVDILSRWPACKPFEFFNKRQELPKVGKGETYVIDICKSFDAALSTISIPQDQVALLQDLLCDIVSFNEEILGNTLDIPAILSDSLVPTFLKKGHFGLVASYLESDTNVMDTRQVARYVIDYLDEIIFSEDSSRIDDAIKCQDILEPVLPEIKPLCQSNRRFLDASHFVSNVLFEGKSATPVTPADFKEMAALDAVETVLRETPECIVCRCSQWSDFDYARKANKQLREVEGSTSMLVEQRPNIDLPELPGGAVFHLATILGLETNVSAVIVKSRVIHYALICGFHGAGAAIARTFIHDHDFGSDEDSTLDAVKLGAIADVVSNENYMDQSTKKELCTAVLSRFKKGIAIKNSEAFSTILRVSSNLDHITSRFEHELCELPSKRKDTLLSRPIARLHVHTFHEYNRDMHCLFKDLSSQASQGLVHDSLMDALSRFVFYWCIHDSKTTKNVIDLRHKEDAKDNLVLGCSLMLQIPSNLTAASCVNELQEIAVAQAASVATEERFEARDATILPDPAILKHLVDRGFSHNGARRAVTMTGNAGCREALAWAVQHTMDDNFNDPLIRLKSSNGKFIDEGSIQLLQKSLIQLSTVNQNPVVLSAFIDNLGNNFGTIKEGRNLRRSTGTKAKEHSTNGNSEEMLNNNAKPMQLKTQPRHEELTPDTLIPVHSPEENGSTSVKTSQTVNENIVNIQKRSAKPIQQNVKQKIVPKFPEENGSTPVDSSQTVQPKRPSPPPPRGLSPTVSKQIKAVPKASTAVGAPNLNGSNSLGSEAPIKTLSKPTNEREALRNKAKITLKKLQAGSLATANGIESEVISPEAKIVTKTTAERREKLLKRGQAARKREETSKTGNDNGNSTENSISNVVPNGGEKTGAKLAKDRREELLKRAQAARERKQMASNATSEQKVESKVPGLRTKIVSKTAIERREELLKKGQAARKKEGATSKEEKNDGSTTNRGVVGMRTKIATKSAMDRREELLKKAQAALGKRRTSDPGESDSRTRLIQEGRELFLQSSPRAATKHNRPTTLSKSSVSKSSSLSSSSKPRVPARQQQVKSQNLPSHQPPPPPPPSTMPTSKVNVRPVTHSAAPTAVIANGGGNGKVTKIETTENDDSGWEFDDFEDF